MLFQQQNGIVRVYFTTETSLHSSRSTGTPPLRQLRESDWLSYDDVQIGVSRSSRRTSGFLRD